jgi:hypothetical protein
MPAPLEAPPHLSSARPRRVAPAALGLLLLVSACGSGSDAKRSDAGCVVPTTGARARYVLNTLTLPQQRTDFALDLNGDGRLDDALGNLVGALAANNLDLQAGLDAAVAAGEEIVLLDLEANDLQSSSCAAAHLQMGADPAPPPAFDGTDVLTTDPAFPGGAFRGALTGGAFVAESPATTTRPVSMSLELPLFPGVAPVRLDLVGAHLEFVRSGGLVTGGRLHGALRNADVQSVFVPGLAASLNAVVVANPGGTTAQQILAIFDTGGTAETACSTTCRNLDGSCAVAHDGAISTCEVATNPIIRNVLNPDVQLFDAGGSYRPNPANTTKDSFSVGLGFTAVPATF